MNRGRYWQPKIDRLVRKARTIYHGIPQWLRFVLAPLKFGYWLVDVLRPDLWVMTGEEVRSKQELTIIYAGISENRHFIKKLAFHEGHREEHIGKTWLWSISKASRSTDHKDALVITEVPRSFRLLFRQPMTWYVPCWVHGELDISSDAESLFRSRSLRSDINKIKNAKLALDVTDDDRDVFDFYHSMHLPFITQTHGDRAVAVDYELVKRELRRCDLVFITREEQRLAGALVRYSKRRAELWFLGIRDGNLEYVKQGVIGALYYFPILYLQTKGIQRVDFGPSRAFLRNGVLQYKRKWNQTLCRTSIVGFLIRPLVIGAAVKGFFCNNPFIVSDGKKLSGAIFVDEDEQLSQDYFARICKERYFKGMSELVVFRFGEVNNEMPHGVPSELSGTIVVRSVECDSK